MIESLLVKIASFVFKKAILAPLFKAVSTAYEIYSVFNTLYDFRDCIQTTNDCRELCIYGLKLISDPLTDAILNSLVNIGSHKYQVEKTSSGIYIASSLVPIFKVSDKTIPSKIFTKSNKIFVPGGEGLFSKTTNKFKKW